MKAMAHQGSEALAEYNIRKDAGVQSSIVLISARVKHTFHHDLMAFISGRKGVDENESMLI